MNRNWYLLFSRNRQGFVVAGAASSPAAFCDERVLAQMQDERIDFGGEESVSAVLARFDVYAPELEHARRLDEHGGCDAQALQALKIDESMTWHGICRVERVDDVVAESSVMEVVFVEAQDFESSDFDTFVNEYDDADLDEEGAVSEETGDPVEVVPGDALDLFDHVNEYDDAWPVEGDEPED